MKHQKWEANRKQSTALLAWAQSSEREASRYYPAYRVGNQWVRFSSRGQDVGFATEQEAAEYLRGVAGDTHIEHE